jgi:glucans biosynthesis protein
MVARRDLLRAGGAAGALGAIALPIAASASASAAAMPAAQASSTASPPPSPPPPIALRFGRRSAFSFDALIEQARAAAAHPYAPPPTLPQDVLERINYEAHGKIRFKPEFALFADGPGRFPVTFFHVGRYFRSPVRMYAVQGGIAREVLYDTAYFDMPADSPARELPAGAGFAGFRVQESRLGDPAQLDWHRNDWVAFLGASYFRSIGQLYQYGLSARAVAIDVAVPGGPEEFPLFTRFYIEAPAADADTMTVCALLDGPSISGAYRFRMRREPGAPVTMDVDAALFLRADVQRLGIAPLTSMYWFSETIKSTGIDWRPEVHDSDGLAMWTGAGEHIWRPLDNPAQITVSAFSDDNPRGFGLLQRDRVFDHYQDGVNYDRRPSLWVEPLPLERPAGAARGLGTSAWGAGSVQLAEIPTDDETNDNIVAMWVPKEAARAGASYRLRYRLTWGADEPYPTPLARCVATRLGRGGQPGLPRPPGVEKFIVEFLGGPLATLPFGVKPEAVITTTRGQLSLVFTEAVPDGVAGHWRAVFDLTVAGKEPVDLRMYLKSGDSTLSETWLFQYHPLS